MTDTRIADLERALSNARDHLYRCEQELERFDCCGPDYRNAGTRLADDVARARNDVTLLSHALWAAQHAQEAFAE
jgi:hypothetical protein